MQLAEACNRGDEASKEMIEKLSPQMASTLKKAKQWEKPSVPLEDKPEGMKIISTLSEISPIESTIDTLIDKELSHATATTASAGDPSSPQTEYALANLLDLILTTSKWKPCRNPKCYTH